MGIPEIPSASEAMDIAADLASRLAADDTPPPPDSSSSATGTTERSSAAADAAPLPDPVGELRFQVTLDDAPSARSPSAAASLSSTTSSSTRRAASRASSTSSGAGSSTRTSCSSAASPTRTRCSSGSSTRTDRDQRGQRHPEPPRRRRPAGAHLVVRGRVPGQVVGPVLQRQVDERRDRDPRDRPPGPDAALRDAASTPHRIRAGEPPDRGRRGDRLLVQPQGVHDREGQPVGGQAGHRRRAADRAVRRRAAPEAEPAAAVRLDRLEARRQRRHGEAVQDDGGAEPRSGSGKGKNSGRPPMVTFIWGSTVTFKAVADNLSVQYTLFRADGTPVRAQAQLSLIQAEQGDGQVEPARARRSRRTRPRARSPGSAPTRSATATASPRSPSPTTATRRAGARSPRPTASTTRCASSAGPSSPSPAANELPVAGAEVKVDGQKLDDRYGQQLVEVRMQENLRLPDACLLRFTDPSLENDRLVPDQDRQPDRGAARGHRRHLAHERLQGDGRLARARVRPGHDARLPRLRRLAPAPPDQARRDLPEHDRRGHRAEGRAARRRRRGDDRQRGARPRLRPAEQRDRLGVPLAARAAHRLRGARHRPQALLPQGRPAGGDAGHHPQVGRQPDQLPAARDRRAAGRPGDRPRAQPGPQPAVRGDREREPAGLARSGSSAPTPPRR